MPQLSTKNTKVCPKCLTEKINSEFVKDKRNKNGVGSYCHSCQSVYGKSYRKDNPRNEEEDERRREANNPGARLRNVALWHKNNPTKVKDTQRKTHYKLSYGMPLWEIEQRVEKQDYLCAICKRQTKGLGRGKYGLCVDHNHNTGQIRELLCGQCNLGLGYFYENPEALRKAAEYLEKYS